MGVEEQAPVWLDAAFGPRFRGPLLHMIQAPHAV